ncbi:acyl-CoA synthetase (AMP-forming)/AMP-acid ligase II [Achromobacter deleyi]|uniref:class I adenylate-forming enzyme family protein n=1 Tax=Achromobacter TaxID=222 RepID=UPI000CFBE135|nr:MULTISPECIES: class I adenylate-forming enzyme family protein [Achromobacter]MDR6599823.1 acyl-CoA synthetase (AMP-forming)/AMP-acid ligase II [Achromobacter deleyi]PQZ64418.1 AMP-dependent synthetase [Achromobacter sp. MYb9]
MTHPLKNLGELADPSRFADLPAIVDLRLADAPVRYSHGDVHQLAGGVAAWLATRGLPAGARIAIAALNRAEYLITYFGIMRAGFVAVPINIKQTQENIDYVIRDAGIALAFVDSARRAAFEATVPVLDFDDAGPQGFAAQILPTAFDTIIPAPDDVAQMLYTSGSTGKPKGVPLTHAGQLWALAATSGSAAAPDSQEHYLLAQPLFHMNGLFMAKRAFASHSLLVIQPAFDVAAYADALERYRITVLTAVPTMFARLVKEPALLRDRDLSSLGRVMLGSAPMTAALYERIQQALPQVRITHGYGTTEAGPAVFGPHPDGLPTPPLAVGYPIDPSQVRLASGANPDEGVLLMKNPAVLSGYHNLPEKSAQVLRDGWYYSGDVMRRDAQGFYYFVGRADDMFVCGGENIYPVEVEKLLELHPDVRQSCVVPLDDEERGQIPVAFIVRRDGSALDAESLKRHALASGPAYQHPRRIRFVDELPWAGTNKVDRNALLLQARALEAGQKWTTYETEAA